MMKLLGNNTEQGISRKIIPYHKSHKHRNELLQIENSYNLEEHRKSYEDGTVRNDHHCLIN